MNRVEQEILIKTQEEAAEVIQAISKIYMFGMDSVYEGSTNKEKFEEELGDLLAMTDLLIEFCIVSDTNVNAARKAKIGKLKKYSNIFGPMTHRMNNNE